MELNLVQITAVALPSDVNGPAVLIVGLDSSGKVWTKSATDDDPWRPENMEWEPK